VTIESVTSRLVFFTVSGAALQLTKRLEKAIISAWSRIPGSLWLFQRQSRFPHAPHARDVHVVRNSELKSILQVF